MKKGLILLAILTLCTTVNAQSKLKTNKAKISWGQEIKTYKNGMLSDLVGFDEDGYYALQVKGRYGIVSKFYIEYYSNSGNLNMSKVLEIESKSKSRNYVDIKQLNGKLYLFTSFLNRKTKKNYLFYQELSTKTLSVVSEPIKIAEIDFTNRFNSNAGNFSLELSHDNSKLLVYFNEPYKKKDPEKFGFHVFDNNMTELWASTVTLPYSDQLFEIEDFHVSNRGEVYLLGLKYEKRPVKKRKGEPNYKYMALCYDNTGKEKKRFNINIPGLFIIDTKIEVDKQNNLVCAGFYSKLESGAGDFDEEGSFYLKIDGETQEVLKESHLDFSMELLKKGMRNWQQKSVDRKSKKNKDLKMMDLKLRDLEICSDGSSILVGEQHQITTTTGTDSQGNSYTKYKNYHRDLFVVKISQEGDILWNQKVIKRQVEYDLLGFFSSYAFAEKDGTIHFIYNGNAENLFIEDGKKLNSFTTSGKKSIVTLASISADGNISRKALFLEKEAKVQAIPKLSKQLDNGKLIIFGKHKKRQRFAVVDFL